MAYLFDVEIRVCLASGLGRALGTQVDARAVHLPARFADASLRIPQGADPNVALHADYGYLLGESAIAGVKLVHGWLLYEFSPAFLSALVYRINAESPLPQGDGGDHAINSMLMLARQGGEGCPQIPAMRRALLEALSARNSPAAFRRAARAAETLFRETPPRDRPALLARSGALGGALARLLSDAR